MSDTPEDSFRRDRHAAADLEPSMPADPRSLIHDALFPTLWLAWAAYWWASSRNVKTTLRQEPFVSRGLHLGPLLIAAGLLWTPRLPWPWLGERFMPYAPGEFWAGAALTITGLLFSVWARRHIGRNWSAIVTVKDDHELVTSGPYALVRHPIYAGLLLGFVGSAIARCEWRGVVAVAIVYLSLLRKYRLEERWMRERFGTAYDDYRQRVKALVPHLF